MSNERSRSKFQTKMCEKRFRRNYFNCWHNFKFSHKFMLNHIEPHSKWNWPMLVKLIGFVLGRNKNQSQWTKADPSLIFNYLRILPFRKTLGNNMNVSDRWLSCGASWASACEERTRPVHKCYEKNLWHSRQKLILQIAHQALSMRMANC